jgi:hypothetical protein
MHQTQIHPLLVQELLPQQSGRELAHQNQIHPLQVLLLCLQARVLVHQN